GHVPAGDVDPAGEARLERGEGEEFVVCHRVEDADAGGDPRAGADDEVGDAVAGEVGGRGADPAGGRGVDRGHVPGVRPGRRVDDPDPPVPAAPGGDVDRVAD